MSNASHRLRQAIASEGARVVSSWPYSDKRTAIVELCRAIDGIYLGTDENSALADAARQGANKAILFFVDQSFNEERTGIFPSNERTFHWALAALTHCSSIAISEKLLDYEKAGLCTFSLSHDQIRVEVSPKYAGMEALEVAEFDNMRATLSDMQRPFNAVLDSDWDRISGLMRPLVYRWAGHFIGYDAHPEVDGYFYYRGLLLARLMTGQDAFKGESSFGGLPFSFYIRVVCTMVGWALKHVEFARILNEREPDLELQNLITVTADVDRISEYVAAALGSTQKEAAQAISVLEMNLGNAAESCINGHAPPPLIRTSRQQFLRPLTGLLQTPFEFMLRGLKRDYRRDWDRAVGEREDLFREELFVVFHQPWLIKLPRSIKLRGSGAVVTDIDAAILDLRNGVAGLFQLKWQDTFGHSMRERWARMQNFQHEAAAWIQAVHDYFAQSTTDEVRQLFGIPSKDWRPFQLCYFVIGRNFAHFSGDNEPDPRAAWGVWAQVVRLCRENKDSNNPVRRVHSELVRDSPMKRKVNIERATFKLGELTITTEPQ